MNEIIKQCDRILELEKKSEQNLSDLSYENFDFVVKFAPQAARALKMAIKLIEDMRDEAIENQEPSVAVKYYQFCLDQINQQFKKG